MIAILKALVRIASNLERIREILELVHKKELEQYELYKLYTKKHKKTRNSDREFEVIEPLLDEYNEPIPTIELDND